jgi:hypothetical protein
VGPTEDSEGRVMSINSCLSLLMQLGAKILKTLRHDIYLLHNELPLAKEALSGWKEGRPMSQVWHGHPGQQMPLHWPLGLGHEGTPWHEGTLSVTGTIY